MSNIEKRTSEALEILKEAIIEVLSEEAKNSDGCLNTAEISERSGLFRVTGYGIKHFNDSQATGLLKELYREGRVKRCIQKSGRNRNKSGWMLNK